MTEPLANRSIRIEDSAVGSAIVSGDGNTIYVIHQVKEQPREPLHQSPKTIGPNPYKGLAAFNENDADRYFGREAQIKRLWQRLQDLVAQSEQAHAVPRLLPILGPSGCGKSSVARAGLIPELARQPLPGKEQMRVAVLVPGTHPVEALAGVLAKVAAQDPMPVTKAREFAHELSLPTAAGSYDGLRRIADLMPQIRDAPLLVLVDQFEEVYSLCRDPAERQAFIENLLCAASDPAGSLSVVITLRSDFLGETQRHPGLNQVIGSDWSMFVPAMTVDELRRAIAEPASQAGHPLDQATVDLLVNDTEGREGALPLLQFALTSIWEGLGQGIAPSETYRSMGGVGGALAGKAQAIYDRLSDAEKDIARRIFLGLVQLGEGTRDTRRRAEVESLMASQDTPELLEQVLERFSSPGARLVTLSGQGNQEVAEVTHEALFSHWQLLNTWLDTSRDDIRFQRRLQEAAAYWEKHGRAHGLLWRSPDLDLLRTFEQKARKDMTPQSVAFFEASNQAEEQEQWRRHSRIAALVAGLVVMTVLSGFSGYKVHQAERRRMQFYQASAESLAGTDEVGSLINGLAAIGLGRSPYVKFPAVRGPELVSPAVLDKPNRSLQAQYVASHLKSVSAVAFSPDGEIVVSTGEDQTIRLWNPQGNPVSALFEGHAKSVSSVAFSPDGQIIVSGSSDQTVRLWDRQGNPVGEPFKGHTDAVLSVAFSPDGQTIVSGSRDQTLRLWDLQGNPIGEPFKGHTDAVSSVAFSPDGQTIVSGSRDQTLRLWDLQGNPIGEPLKGHSAAVRAVAFSPNGQTIVSGSFDQRLRLWDRQGNPIGEPFQGHSAWVTSVAFSPDGQTIISGSVDKTVRLWDLQGNPVGKPLAGYTAPVWSVAFSPDGQTIVTGNGDQTVRFWNRQTPPISPPFNGYIAAVLAVDFSPDGEIIASGGEDQVLRLWDRQGNPVEEPFQGHSGWVYAVSFSPDGETIASGGEDQTIRLWDRQGNSLAAPFEGHTGGVSAIAFSPDGSKIVSGSRDQTLRLWNLQGKLIGEPWQGHSDGVAAVAFSPDGQTIVSSSDVILSSLDAQTDVSSSNDRTIQLWDLQGNPIGQPFSHTSRFFSVAFSPDGQTIASGGLDQTVQLWDLQGNPIGQPFRGHTDAVYSVDFSPDGQTIISGSWDQTIRLWDLDGNPIGPPLEGHSDSVYSVDFSPDGQTIVSGSRDQTVRLWPVWLAEAGWVTYTCNRLRGYLLVASQVDDVTREARKTCDRYAWKQG